MNTTETKKAGDFEPKIMAFCCRFCAYASADLAGSMRIQYPPNVRIILTPCTGRLEVTYFMKAFEQGADGVLVAGCLEGGCHFQEGNLHAKMKVIQAKMLLKEVGLEPERLEMYNISASNSVLFARAADEMTELARKLGPNPLKKARGEVK